MIARFLIAEPCALCPERCALITGFLCSGRCTLSPGGLAEAAAAVGVVLFGRGAAELFGAALAGAVFVVERRFAGFEGFARWGDLVSFGREDDALHGAFVIGGGEFHFGEIVHGGAVDSAEGVGFAGVDFVVVEGEADEVEVEVDGGAVLGVDERERLVDSVGRGLASGGQDALEVGVMAAEAGSVDGWLLAVASSGKDVAA
jgi:hypothetical protein